MIENALIYILTKADIEDNNSSSDDENNDKGMVLHASIWVTPT